MRIYVAGAMTGLPLLNYPAFHAAAAKLRGLGHEVQNPAENTPPSCGTWLGWMRLCVTQLAQCDAIYMLPGWERSKGAKVEHQLACGMGLAVLYATVAPMEWPLQDTKQ